MKIIGSGNQIVRHPLYCADGTVASGGTAQLVLGQSQARSLLLFQNISAENLFLEIGSARATATLSSGTVASCAVTNAGFNFTKPPVIEFLGGGATGNSSFLGGNQPDYPAPSHPAKAHCVLTAGAVSSIVIDDPGAGYAIAPYVYIYNSDLDPYGCALPSATSGMLVQPGGQVSFNYTSCPTDPVAVYGGTTSQGYLARWMD